MDRTTDLLERGEHAEAGEDSEELLLRGAHGLDELAVHVGISPTLIVGGELNQHKNRRNLSPLGLAFGV